MKTQEEIRKILEEQFYENVLNFHIAVIRRCYSVDDFLRRVREIINNAVCSISEEKKKRKAVKLTLNDAYTKIRDLHMLALQEAISLDAFQKRKKDIIYNAAGMINFDLSCNV